ncbi:MAG: class I SAM-dependent DNA methyltransferase [Acidobacteria bacterium]|nr:class I SAM-dependent DNA methyltransferase [Acidobacteriota bacterium]MBI3664271.1 class I SAM-dependent DNA methyltransferase [Acidobacteriota bacterium]
MPLSWNEIRHRAIAFSKAWTGVKSESAEKQTFWNEFFDVFGVSRRAVASFEEPVKKLSGHYGAIDLFWKRILLVEHKSAGQDLSRAQSQAFDYIQALVNEGRHDEIPRYVIVSDFARVALYDLEPEDQKDLPLFAGRRVESQEFPITEFHQRIHAFAFIPGYKQHRFVEQDPINIEAVEIMGRLHDALEAGGYSGHQLERFLVRILFCLFAEDTGIFEREAFRLYVLNRTAADGSDLGVQLEHLFRVLNTDNPQRQKHLDETLAAFPYVNGDLFSEKLDFADFNRDMRNALLACTEFDWSRISPAVFGSLFQAVMEPQERRQIGGHYTNERDILKVIRSLFLDDLRAEFERAKSSKAELKRFHDKLSQLRFLDPACGCGNFLVITYRELRLLEIEILKAIYPGEQKELDIQRLSLVDVDAFYGIEISEWPVRIAEVAMWLMDHQMNIRLSEAFGQYFVRLPLRKSPTIVCGNALRLDWKKILPPAKCSYVLGNPPFVGGKFQTDEQRADMDLVARDVENSGLLDYVTGWYFKAADYIQDSHVVVGFVSTNSITQGEQAGVLWNALFQRYGVKIHFGHRTFVWQSEARGKAHVHVVIVGFAAFEASDKRIYEYAADEKQPVVSAARNISPYLIEGSDRAVTNRTAPVSRAPEIYFGNQPIDGGHLLLDQKEKAELLAKEPKAKQYLRLFLGAQEFINGEERWCLWLHGASPAELRTMPEVMRRVEAVRESRLASKRPATRELAAIPTEFAFVSHRETNYLLIPSVSSERRLYIPIGFMPRDVIASNLCLIIPGAKPFHFGVLSSTMHMAWVKQVCGRLKSDYRYSAKLVYNNYPWPEAPSAKQRAAVEKAAQAVLDARKKFPESSLADLYDPLAMPPALVKAHAELDRAVDLCYRPQPFQNDRQRVEHLFALYEKLTAPLIAPTKKGRRKTHSN